MFVNLFGSSARYDRDEVRRKHIIQGDSRKIIGFFADLIPIL